MKKKSKRTIEAEEIELVDAEGRTRALLSTHQRTGLPFLAFLDELGNQRLVIGIDAPNRAVLSMMRENGRTFFGCGQDEQGRVGLTLFDESGSPGLTLRIDPSGERTIQVLDPNLNVMWEAPPS